MWAGGKSWRNHWLSRLTRQVNASTQNEYRLTALQHQMQRLQVAFTALVAGDADGRVATAMAQELGYPVEVLVVSELRVERRALARKLSGQGWSAARIARSLRCCEKTVRRWCKSAA